MLKRWWRQFATARFLSHARKTVVWQNRAGVAGMSLQAGAGVPAAARQTLVVEILPLSADLPSAVWEDIDRVWIDPGDVKAIDASGAERVFGRGDRPYAIGVTLSRRVTEDR